MTEMGTCIVTGGSRGIGAAVSRLAAQRGYAVCINYASAAEAAQAMVDEIVGAGGRAVAVQGDMADPRAVTAMFDAAHERLGPITAVVNNAGLTGRHGRLDEAELETLRRVTDVNVNGVLYCAREAVRRMSTRHGGKGGSIVNISSGAATLGSANSYVWYAASKGAVNSLTIGLAGEVGEEGIRVNAVAPGLITTDIHAAGGVPDRAERLSVHVPMKRPGTPDEVANSVLWLLSDEASYVTGAILRVGGGR